MRLADIRGRRSSGALVRQVGLMAVWLGGWQGDEAPAVCPTSRLFSIGRKLVVEVYGVASVVGSTVGTGALSRDSSVAGSAARSVIAYHVSGKHLRRASGRLVWSLVHLTSSLLADEPRLVAGASDMALLIGSMPGLVPCFYARCQASFGRLPRFVSSRAASRHMRLRFQVGLAACLLMGGGWSSERTAWHRCLVAERGFVSCPGQSCCRFRSSFSKRLSCVGKALEACI